MPGHAADLAAAERRAIGRRTHAPYRPDIDGLRAIAVVPVVLFHAHIRGFSGGFVGVDIFFVISGYLITGILVRDIAVGRHSIREFYRRRILRIFPALTAMLLATSIMAWWLLLPVEAGRYAASLAGAALFASNAVFYAQSDYFNLGALSQPLLHTWSLAVEEQWYILWPLILAAIGPGRPRATAGVTAAITLASLLLSLWWLPRDPQATFYLLPARAWELGLGALVAMAGERRLRGIAAELVAAAGLVAILACVKLYTKDTPFPALAAVPPCLGAAALLHLGDATRTGRLLALAPLRGLGLVSYSLYLWHWPLIVFAETGLFLPPRPATTVALLAAMLALAILSWRFVERPFRVGVSGWPTPRVLVGGGVAIAVMLLVAAATPAIVAHVGAVTPRERALAAVLASDGDAAYRRGLCFQVGRGSHYDAARCLTPAGGRPVLLLVGDSHAAQLWPGLARHRDRIDVLQATATACVAILDPPPDGAGCERVIDAGLRDAAARTRPAALVLASNWQLRWLPALAATLADPAIRAAHPVLVGPIPQYPTGVPRLLIAAERRHDPGLIARALDPAVFPLDAAMRALAARTGTPYVSLVDLLCRRGACRVTTPAGAPLQFDGSHLTPAGSAWVVDAILGRIIPG